MTTSVPDRDVSAASTAPSPCTLSSAGPDGQLGTDDDIAASCDCGGARESTEEPGRLGMGKVVPVHAEP